MEINRIIEDSELYALHYEDLHNNYCDFPTMERLGREWLNIINSLSNKIINQSLLTPQNDIHSYLIPRLR